MEKVVQCFGKTEHFPQKIKTILNFCQKEGKESTNFPHSSAQIFTQVFTHFIHIFSL